MQRLLFPLSLFLSASLLFIIQPLVAKVLLPVYGGTPAVWGVCMLFFQALLLIAYSYAWVLSRFKGTLQWRIIHAVVCVLSISFLPLTLLPEADNGVPEITILLTLLLQLGLPLLVVGASAPLLQFAFSNSTKNKEVDPYFLYAASNVGSLLALLSYPWLVERFSNVSQQFMGWNYIYVIYLGLLMVVLFGVHYQPPAHSQHKPLAIAWTKKLHWILLSFIPCSLMLGVTFYITTDIAATPLFWVMPLALYLLTFVITFAKKPLISHEWVLRNLLFFLIFPLLGFVMGAHQTQAWQLILAHLTGFFMLALLCHGRLVQLRPPASQLTTFYFCLALGGVVAGLFNGFLSPRLFSHAYEYPLVMWLALFSIPIVKASKEWLIPALVLLILVIDRFLLGYSWANWLHQKHVLGIVALTIILIWPRSARSFLLSVAILFVFIFFPGIKSTEILHQQRNFYGIKQVFSQGGMHVLMSQSTAHGFQVFDGERPNGSQAYYGAILPAVQLLQTMYQPLHAMVLGLGTGIMACQFKQQDHLVLVEIDEQVITIASDKKLFTYLHDCPSLSSIIKEDGRLAVSKAQDASLDLIVIDTFNSDAIPIHMLTLEAIALYQQKIKAGGVLLFNITNRHLKLLPVLNAAARQLGMIILHTKQYSNTRLGQLASEWVLLTNNELLTSQLLSKGGWYFVTDNTQITWTDEYSNIIPILKW